MFSKAKVAIFIVGILVFQASEAKTVRFSEMTPAQVGTFMSGSDLIVEFHQGDTVPVSIVVQGDLLDTSSAGTTAITVKKNFWVKYTSSGIDMSLDGVTFEPFQSVIGGSLTVGASSATNGGPVNLINVMLSGYLK